MKTKVCLTISCLSLLTQTARSGDWATVNLSGPHDATASFIKSFGGSGLGVTVWGIFSKTKSADATATKCCQQRCWCGSISQMVEVSFPATMYIAKTQTGWNLSGQLGDITANSRADALSHENVHVKIRQDLAAKWNPYIASKYPTITINPRSAEQEAKDAAKHMANSFDTNGRLEMNPIATQYNQLIDNTETSQVINGECRHPASNRNALIYTPISNLTPAATLPADSPANCQ